MTGPAFVSSALAVVMTAVTVSAAGPSVTHGPSSGPSPAPPTFSRPLSASVLQQTAHDPRWQALIQRARRWPDRAAREALRTSGFLLSRDGTAESELRATLEAFLAPDPEPRQAARCRFPARYRLLAERGLAPLDRGPCAELDAWREQIGEFGLTLIFPESFLGNPASMFGHTLLRFDPSDANSGGSDPPGESLLGWALDYTADAQGQVGPLYLTRGLFGGYRGRFSLDAYYQKTQVYSDWQDRDIWEYPLAMSREDRELLLLHVWELRDVSLPYYFFTQNCSEKILELLEVVWPGLGRGGGFPPMVAPVDTVRAIAQAEDEPLGVPRLRESPATTLQRRMAGMSTADGRLAQDVTDGRVPLDDERLAARPDAARARILEVAYDLLRHRYLAGKVDEASSRSRSRTLLLARSRIPLARAETEGVRGDRPASGPPPRESATSKLSKRPPDSGHGTARVELAGGIQDRDGFIELRLQPAYHELIDAPGGYAEGGQIRVLDTRVRYFPELERVRLHELVLLDVVTASPWRRPFRPLGWRFDLGLRTRLLSSDRDRGLDTEGVFRLQGGVGGALAPLPGLLLYGFGELALESGAGLEGDVTGGPVTRSGLAWTTPGERVSLQLEAIAGVLAGERTAPWLRLEIAERTALSRTWSIVVSGRYEHAYDVGHLEGRLGLLRYF